MLRHLPALFLALGLATGCSRDPSASPLFFRDVTAGTGVSFVHAQSDKGRVLYLPETLGPGVASVDFDGDGLPDLFFVQGSGRTNGKDAATIPRSALYRNHGPGAPFEDAGAASGAHDRGWGQSCLAFDANNDGYQDLAITGYYEPVKLFLNNGDGTFRAAGRAAGLPHGDRWFSFLTAIDLERDGMLDLYVGAYVKFKRRHWLKDPAMLEIAGMRLPETMAPRHYEADENVFLSNCGDGTFQDRAAELGLTDPAGRGMGAVAADLDHDGWTDLFVANDLSPCALFRNVAGKPQEIAASAYVGESRGSMGIALGDVDRDGLTDMAVSHWVGDIPALYQGQRAGPGKLAFRDAAEQLGLGPIPRRLVGWAITLQDLDLDGRDDLFILNGHTGYIDGAGALIAQEAVLLRGDARGSFEMMAPPEEGAQPLRGKRVARAGAFTDLDNDGGVDVAIGVNNGPAEVWHNVAAAGGWIGADLVGTTSNRDAVGARLELTAGDFRRTAHRASGESFFSSNDPRRVFGLGAVRGPFAIRVHWPSGRSESFDGLAAGRYHRLVESAGK